jgi:hypothetical protein
LYFPTITLISLTITLGCPAAGKKKKKKKKKTQPQSEILHRVMKLAHPFCLLTGLLGSLEAVRRVEWVTTCEVNEGYAADIDSRSWLVVRRPFSQTVRRPICL